MSNIYVYLSSDSAEHDYTSLLDLILPQEEIPALSRPQDFQLATPPVSEASSPRILDLE